MWQPCTLCHVPTSTCSSLAKTDSTWLHLEQPEKYFCSIDIDSTTIQSLQMEIQSKPTWRPIQSNGQPSMTAICLSPKFSPLFYACKKPTDASTCTEVNWPCWHLFSSQKFFLFFPFLFILTLSCTYWELVSWYFEPSQPQRVTSWLITMFNLAPIYSARKSSNHKLSINHKISHDTNLHKTKHTQTLDTKFLKN